MALKLLLARTAIRWSERAIQKLSERDSSGELKMAVKELRSAVKRLEEKRDGKR